MRVRFTIRCAFALFLTIWVLADNHEHESSCADEVHARELRHHILLQVQSQKTVEQLQDAETIVVTHALAEEDATGRLDGGSGLVLRNHSGLTSLAMNESDELSELIEDASIAATGFVQNVHASPFIDWIKDLWSNRELWMHFGLWISIPLAMLALALRVRRFEVESGSVRGRIVPIAAASSTCVFLSMGTQKLGYPWDHFSPTTALITVVFVMDMGTLERFIIKVTLRTLGTILGGVLAIIAGEFSDLCDHHMMIQVCCCFTVFSFDMVLAKKFNYMAYTFTMQSVTFALVFFGYVARGWEAVWERLFSVFVGVCTAVLCNAIVSATDGGIGEVTAIVSIIQKSEQIFNRALVALDFAFMRNTILAAPDGAVVEALGQAQYQEEVMAWFVGIDHEERPRTCEDLKELARSTPTIGEDLKELARSTTFHDLPMDVTVSVLQAECRQCWSDMKFIRAIFPHNFCGRRVFQSPLPSFCSLPERAHPVFLQASALAHSGAIDAAVWKTQEKELENIRKEIQDLQRLFAKLFEYKLLSQKQKNGPSKENKLAVLDALDELFKGLDIAQASLNSIWTPPGTSRSSSSTNAGVFSLGGSRGLRGANRSPAAWDRFHGFCQGLSLILMDFSLFALCCIKLMDIEDDEDDRLDQIISRLANCGGIELSALEEQMEAPLDIDSSDIAKNWRKRAKKAARKALEPLGLQDLVPKHKRRGRSGETSKPATGTHSGAASQSFDGAEAHASSASHSLRLHHQRIASQSSESSSVDSPS